MANVKLTWNDNSSNETGFKLYRLKGETTSANTNWSASGTGNEDSAGASISPLVKTLVAGTDYTAGDATQEYVDTGVGVGSWTYRLSAYNDAGETWCLTPEVQVVTVTA